MQVSINMHHDLPVRLNVGNATQVFLQRPLECLCCLVTTIKPASHKLVKELQRIRLKRLSHTRCFKTH